MQNPTCPLTGRKVRDSEEEERKKNNGKYYGHYVYTCSPRAAHALRSDQQSAEACSINTVAKQSAVVEYKRKTGKEGGQEVGWQEQDDD